jgi:hypothetical protein
MIGASSFSGGGHKLMRNDGTTFTNVTVGSGYDLFTGTSIEFVAQDFNNDGYIDVLGGGALMLNNGDMTFTQTLIPANNGPIGDLNNDGFLDIQNGGTIWMNQGNDNNWINVLATGVNSNTSAIGARIEVTSALGTQIRDIRSGDGFRYMSTLTAHFGLGTDDAVSEVTIKWPDGSVEHIFEPAINGTLQLVEGQSSVGISSLPAAAFSIFPSPAMDKLQLRTAEDLSGSDITVSDLSGKTVLRPSLLNSALDVSTLSPGMYLLKIQGAGLHYTSKFVKQ